MSSTGIPINEGRRCADLIDAQAAQLDALLEGEECTLCHTLDSYAQKLRSLSSDLVKSAELYEKHHSTDGGEAGRAWGAPTNLDLDYVKELLGKIAGELDKFADDVPDEISARENLYFRMRDAAREARIITKELH